MWLNHPQLRSFVRFASGVLGLLCYALSSSFNSLFGKWNLLKTFLYCVFSFIICTADLFVKVSHGAGSLRLSETIRDVFKNLENLIYCDSAIGNVTGGIETITAR
ncbi:uncharacterized protein LOC127740589 [Arachis duranensis]|uniref:Uncharacterized protein LOC127740589 n=1 Tax=Arachis duranensis TaxID=130453 RepID=A0A9C6WA92_ARADU|nr:uncharacterized protein LOC127740589 [Arachis duranensis]